MAAPVLKTTSVNAPRRVLRPSGVVPTSKPKLKGADGKTIQPKAPKPAVEPAAEAGVHAAAAAQEAEAAAAKAAAEAAAKAAEEEARAKAEEEARAAEEAAAKAAQEEYERQMAEYNRQMEEYNRQMAAIQAEEAARAVTAAQEAAAAAEPKAAAPKTAKPTIKPAGAPTVKPNAAKPAGAKLAGAKPAGAKLAPKPAGAKLAAKAPMPAAADAKKAKPAPAPAAAAVEGAEPPAEGEAAPEQEQTMSEAELNARDARIAAMQLQAAKPPIWKTPKFYIGAGVLVAIIGICTSVVLKDKAEKEAAKAYETKVNTVLKRAEQINRQGVETLSDAQAKNVNIECSMDDAKCLLSIVVNPFVKNSRGNNILGGDPEGVARQACLLLGIASEKYPEIDKVIFDTLTEECNNPTFKPGLFRWLVQRMTVSNNKGINKKLKKLARAAAKKDLFKGSETAKWKHKGEVLAAVWESIGLRVTTKDVPELIELLKDDACEAQLATTLANCLDNVVMMIDDPAEKAKVGDQIFEALPEKLRRNMAGTLAHACSTKALEYYKKRAENPKNWRMDGTFFGNYYNDEIIPFLQGLKPKANGDAKLEQFIDRCITSVVGQNRPRTIDEADKLIALVFDKINENTSDWDAINEKTDPEGIHFIGEDNPEYAKLMERRKVLEKCRAQKMSLITALSCMHNHEWVVTLLEKYMKDPDTDIATEATNARKQVDKNTADDRALRAGYKARDKE